ncbi:MAG: Muramoyltetrapeptide carboxypeptidase, partial [uncultured bacterium]
MKTNFLTQNNSVYFLSPSMAPQKKHLPTIQKSKETLRKLGLRIYEPKILQNYYMGGTIKERLAQFDEFLSGQYVMATPIVGGKSCNQLLDKLPYENIKSSQKIFLGLSDFTSILLAIYSQTGLMTYHFSDPAGGMGNNPDWSSKQLELLLNPDAQYNVVFHKSLFNCINNGVADGILLGGNLSSICRLTGTKYCPDFTGAILFLEACNTSVGEVDANIGQLKQAGILDHINGLILGSFFQADKEIAEINYSFSQLLDNWEFSKKIPTLKTTMFGHFTDNIIMPEGLNVRLDSGKGTLNGL